MTCKTAFLCHQDYLGYNFGPGHPLKPKRYKDMFELLQKLGIFDEMVKHYKPKHASEEDLMLVHLQEYIRSVKRRCEGGMAISITVMRALEFDGSVSELSSFAFYFILS